ncbi:putative null [Colletotrichum sublineola]|uniref:Putative null n=1 Tax=Colletotrichum sublineola TaxID=1173701 RepID=A0A066X5D9_COLSU|nr:putative null [Colletotrichum sublineola]
MVSPARTQYPTYTSKFGPKYVFDCPRDPTALIPGVQHGAQRWRLDRFSGLEVGGGGILGPDHWLGGIPFGAGLRNRREAETPIERDMDNRDFQNTMLTLDDSGTRAAGFGAAAAIGALFFASGIPRIQRDILMKIPVIGQVYVKDIPPSDNEMHGSMEDGEM